MKNMKKLFALLVAVLMIAASMSALAAQTAGTDTSVVVSGLTPGDSVKFYHVIKWVGDATPNVSGWYWTDDFASLGTDALIAAIDDQTTATYTGFTSELAGDISRIAATKNPVDTVPVTGDSATYAINDDTKLGTYIALVTPKDASTVYNPAFVSADWNTGSNDAGMITDSTYYNKSAAKKSTIDLTKTSENASDYSKDNGETVAVGDVLDFTVTTTIPGYGDTFDAPAFKLVDTMTDLELQVDTVTITAEGATADSYTLTKDTAGYTVNFKPAYLKSLAKPTALTITYKAKVLTSAAVANVDKKENTVTLEYSHDPSTETNEKPGGDKEYKKEKTTHYTFTIDANNLWSGSDKIGESGSEIIKISVDRNGNPIYEETKTYSNITETEYEASPLAGCVFELYKVEGNNTWTKTGNAIATATSDANGRIKFENLDEGRYILVETSAPAGYVRDTSEHKVEIIADTETKSITEYYDQNGTWYPTTAADRKPFTYEYTELNSYQIKFDGTEVANHTFDHRAAATEIKWSNKGSTEAPSSIHNTKGVELPSTGGMGTTLFYIGGAVLVLGAVVVMITRRRVRG